MARNRNLGMSDTMSMMVGASVGTSVGLLAGGTVYATRKIIELLTRQQQEMEQAQRPLKEYAKRAGLEYDALVEERGYAIPQEDIVSNIFHTEEVEIEQHDSLVDAIFGS